MAISKIIYKTSSSDTGTVWMDVTQKTVTAGSMLSGTTALKADGTDITGNIASKTSSDLTANVLTVTAPAGHYASAASKTLTDQYLLAENIKKDISIFGVTGSYEGGGSSTTVIVPEQTINVNDAYNSVSFLSGLVAGEDYIYTINGVQQTETAWSPGGNTVILQTSNNNIAFEWTGSTMYLDATSSSVYGTYTVKIEQQSGVGSNWTLLASQDIEVNTTSTSLTEVERIELPSGSLTKEDIIFVHVRDKAGKRAGYFYGTDSIFVNYTLANNTTDSINYKGGIVTRYTTSNVYDGYAAANVYGLFPYIFNQPDDEIIMYQRYSSSYSLTINGTYQCDIYKISPATGMTMFT